MFLVLALLLATLPFTSSDVAEAMAGRTGTVVVIDADSGESFRSDPALAARPLPPCSTFKIWNTAIGLETGKIHSADEPFWTWDGRTRDIAAWNHDQTLRSAFAASCVPAYQNLARRIGRETMDEWIQRLNYGDRDTSSGVDVFWLPAPGRKSLLISPDQQAELMVRLAKDGLGFSPNTRKVLADVMLVSRTPKGSLFGKTGTGTVGDERIGWYVGRIESDGRTFGFAALLTGPGVMGADARDVIERLGTATGLLSEIP